MFPDSTILNYLFWMLMGIMQILIIKGAYTWLEVYNKKVCWWQMLLMYLNFLFIVLVIAAATTLMGEFESSAGWLFMGTLTVPLIITFAIMIRFFVSAKKKLLND